MSLSMKYLFAVAVLAGGFEAVAALWMDAPDVAARVAPGVFAVVFLGGAWAMWARHSFAAASVIALFLLIDVAGVPFYTKTSVMDWAVQLAFGLVGLVGLVAWVTLLRGRRRTVSHANG